jgi:hypothetical protein
LFEAATEVRQAGEVLELIELQIKAPEILEGPEEIEIPARQSIDVKLDLRPVSHELSRVLQFGRRQGLTELDNLALGFKWREPVGRTSD